MVLVYSVGIQCCYTVMVYGVSIWCLYMVLVYGVGIGCCYTVLLYGVGIHCWYTVLVYGVLEYGVVIPTVHQNMLTNESSALPGQSNYAKLGTPRIQTESPQIRVGRLQIGN
jgi:hypothetical protein